jgi:hypothetical protein
MTTETISINPTPLEQVVNGAKLVGDFGVVPGASLLVEGKIVEGGTHALLGYIAIRAIGPVGWILVAANAYSKSSSGTSLFEHLSGVVKKKGKKTVADESVAPAAAETV